MSVEDIIAAGEAEGFTVNSIVRTEDGAAWACCWRGPWAGDFFMPPDRAPYGGYAIWDFGRAPTLAGAVVAGLEKAKRREKPVCTVPYAVRRAAPSAPAPARDFFS